jgi:cobalt-zinc-cadmium efflux system membrane fusion protein
MTEMHTIFSPVSRSVRSAVKPLLGFLLAFAVLTSRSPAFAHGGEIEVGAGAKGPVSLSIAQQKAIDLRMVEAGFRPLAELLNLNGEVRLVPGRQADVSTRISGQVKALYANLGDRVKVGQRLVRVQSRLVGDPPPSVNIPAPMSGVVDALNVAIGQSVEPATVLYRISDRSQINVVARLYEEDVAKIRVGQTARVYTLSYPDRVFSGKVILVGPSLDPQSRTLEVWIRLANLEGLLKPNLFARVSVLLKQNSAALSIPRAAVIEANGEKFVFVRQGNQFKRVEITQGVSDDQYVEVSDGLVPGDVVVTQGNRQLYTLWLTGGKPLKGGDGD